MSPKYLVAAAMLAFLGTPLSAQSVKAGIEAWQRADYTSAVAIWRPLAEAGDADAQFNLGQAYRLGRGAPINLALAKSWFGRAAQSGHLDAETTLGLLLFQNGDQTGGLKWLRRAAEQGEPRALLVYGTALYNGDGVPQDRVLGYAYVNSAAQQGLVPARETLSQLDSLMPAADREKGIALSRSIPNARSAAVSARARTAQAGSPAPVAPAKPAFEKPASEKPTIEKPARRAVVKMTARPSKSAPASSGAWRVQLGAFSQHGSAEALYHRLASKAALAGKSPFYVAAGAMTRLQMGPFASRAAAEVACSSLRTSCFPIPAR